MVRKCGGATEVAEVGCGRARGTRARAELAKEAKRRKLDDGGGFIGSSQYMQLRSRRIVLRNSVPRPAISLGCGSENPCSGRDYGISSSSCCSSNESSESRDDSYEFVDLEDDRNGDTETSTFRSKTTPFSELREEQSGQFMETSSRGVGSTTKASDDEDSTTKVSDAECCCSSRRSLAEEKEKTAPTEAELEEFFSEAEKQHLEKFTEKYNFDFLKETPLEGRYEWVKSSQ